MRVSLRLLLGAAALSAACDSPSGEQGPTSLHSTLVAGNAQADSVRATLADSLVVRVTDERGRPVPNLTVGWSVLTQGGGEALPASSLTDADGRARTAWRLGTKAGEHEMEVRSTLDGRPVILDTLRATARPGRAVTAVVSGDSIRSLGPLESTRVFLTGADQHGNPIPPGGVAAAWSSSAGAVVGVSENGTIVAAAPGRATVTATGNGWALRVHVTVTGVRMTIRPAPFVPFRIHGGGTRMLGVGDDVAARQNGQWVAEPGITGHAYLLGVRVLPGGEAWAVAAEPTQRVLWRSTAPGAWARVPGPSGLHAEHVASAQGTVFIGSSNGNVVRREGDGWIELGHHSVGTDLLTIQSLGAASPGEVWAGGNTRAAFLGHDTRPYLAKWENGSWTRISMPAGVALQASNSVTVAAPGDGGPVYALLWTRGSTTVSHLLRITGGAASVVPLPPSMVNDDLVRLGVGPNGAVCVATFPRVACQRSGAWREHVLTDGWMTRGDPFIDGTGSVYMAISRRVNNADEAAVAELEVF